MFQDEDIKQAVRERYAGHAQRSGAATTAPASSCAAVATSGCCGTAPVVTSSCCGTATDTGSGDLGYSAEELAELPDGADLGLGCGNPLAMLELREGETVVDLGSGGGIDCFLASKRVGTGGHVIGVDMTAEMIAKARANARAGGFGNVEFRLGEIDHLPVADATVDAIISNCVVNLVPDKRQVFADAFRVLRSGGRLSLSDIVLLREVPVEIRDSVEAYVACLSGAILRDDYLRLLADAGFADVRVTAEKTYSADDVGGNDVIEQYGQHGGFTRDELEEAASAFQSIRVSARKP